MEQTKTNEPLFRVNIKQTAKGEPYYDVTTKGDTIEEVSERLKQALSLAEETILHLKGDAKFKKLL